jgi:hypothetical protein
VQSAGVVVVVLSVPFDSLLFYYFIRLYLLLLDVIVIRLVVGRPSLIF